MKIYSLKWRAWELFSLAPTYITWSVVTCRAQFSFQQLLLFQIQTHASHKLYYQKNGFMSPLLALSFMVQKIKLLPKKIF